jgi:glycyl-tRNA synthetase beta subunit
MFMALELCRVWMNGKTSMVLTVTRPIRDYFNLLDKDVIAFRFVTIQGKKMILGEKLKMDTIATLSKLPVESLPRED